MQRIKRSLAVVLCMLLMLTPVLAAAPSLTADAARKSAISFTDLERSYNKTTKDKYYVLSTEVGQAFNIGDYITINASSKASKLSDVSKTATYVSSNKAVATITKKGQITPRQVGSTVISVKYRGKTLKATLNVIEQKYSNNAIVADYKNTLDQTGKQYKKFSSIKASNSYAFVNAVTALYVKSLAVEKEVNNEDYNLETGILTVRNASTNGYEYDNRIVVANGTKFNVLYDMLKSYWSMSNPYNTSSKYNSQLQIKKVTASTTGITLDLKSKVTQGQVFGALNRYSLDYLKNFTLDNSYNVYAPITVYKLKQNANGRFVRDYNYEFNYAYVGQVNGGNQFTGTSSNNTARFYTYLQAGQKALNFVAGTQTSYYDDGVKEDYNYAYTYETFTAGTYRAYIGNNSEFYVDFTVK